jgi:hypothetical protein
VSRLCNACHSLLYIHLFVTPILIIIFRKNLYVKFTITFIDFREEGKKPLENDEKGKKPLQNDVEANLHDDIMNPEFWNDAFNTLVNEVYNDLHDKLPYDFNDALDTCMTIQSDLPPLPPPMETQHQMSEINNWKKAIALAEGVDESQVIWFEEPLYGYLV